MAIQDQPSLPTPTKKRSWTAYIPRPGSSSGRPSSSSGSRPSTSNGFITTTAANAGNTGSFFFSSSPSTALPRPSSFVGSFGRRPNTANGFRHKDLAGPSLAAPQEDKVLDVSRHHYHHDHHQPSSMPTVSPAESITPTTPVHTPLTPRPSTSPIQPQQPQSPGLPLFGLRMRRASVGGENLAASLPPSRPPSRPSTPKRRPTSFLLTSPKHSSSSSSQELTHDAEQPVLNAVERRPTSDNSKDSKPTSKSYLSSMMGGLSLSSLSRTNTRESIPEEILPSPPKEGDKDKEREKEKEKDRGRSLFTSSKRPKSASRAATADTEPVSTSVSRSRARSQSPFFFRRNRNRDRETSPTPQPLPLAPSESDLSDLASTSVLPRNAFTDNDNDNDGWEEETAGETDYSDDDDDDSIDHFDAVTSRNTEQNAVIASLVHDGANAIDGEEPDPLGEGVNVVVPPEPYFPTSLNALGGSNARNRRNPRRRKTVKHHEPLPLQTSRPQFQRDRCTITLRQGDPEAKLGTRKKRKYVVASDLSEESRYAVEWGIGTVLRDGDEMLVVTVVENESKIDPKNPETGDRTQKLRSQQERQGLAYILVRQATSLLQRTRLNVTVMCQAWHAKNARHMLLDIVDYTEPAMLIVGSRGLGRLNNILLGSTSHYLIQKCSVPVMVARRRLKRPPKRSAHLSTHRAHVKLSEAGIDRVASKVDQDVKVMRDEMQKEENRRDGGPGSRDGGRGLGGIQMAVESTGSVETDVEGADVDADEENDNEEEGESSLTEHKEKCMDEPKGAE